jgi:hypothetical protein
MSIVTACKGLRAEERLDNWIGKREEEVIPEGK